MARDLTFDFVLKHSEKVTGASNTGYAMIFDPVTGNAVDFTTTIPYGFKAFDGNNFRFGLLLINDRVNHWRGTLLSAALNLPDVGFGQHYTIEYWIQSSTALGARNRNNDYLIYSEQIDWVNNPPDSFFTDFHTSINTVVIDELSATLVDVIKDIKTKVDPLPPEPAAVRYECFLSAVYDSVNTRFGFCAWLEKDAVLQTNIKSAVVTLYDSTNNLILNLTLTVSGTAGQMFGQSLTIQPYPDETYFAVVEITDANNNLHRSAASPVTWD